MNPWIVLGVPATVLFVVFGLIAYGRIAYRRTKNIPIAVGQVWLQNGKKLYVDVKFENGVFGISTAPKGSLSSHASWGETEKDLAQRVRNRKLILIEAAKPSLRTETVATDGGSARSAS